MRRWRTHHPARVRIGGISSRGLRKGWDDYLRLRLRLGLGRSADHLMVLAPQGALVSLPFVEVDEGVEHGQSQSVGGGRRPSHEPAGEDRVPFGDG